MPAIAPPSAFPAALDAFRDPVLVACHNDADGLSAGAILLKALRRKGFEADVRIVGKGENAYSAAFAAELKARPLGGLVIADLGLAAELPRADVPTILVDHHVPTGWPAGATAITGIEDDPVPTSSLLAFRCAKALGEADDLLWLAAIGIIGDLADKDGFPELESAKANGGITALRNASALVNAPRRSASGDASPALALLMKADGPKAVLSGEHPETAQLLAAKEEVKAALEEARRAPPRVVGEVALILFASPCQIHPLVAQAWRGRLKDRIVIAANTGYREGFVHFAARTATDHDILEFLAKVRPPGAGVEYGNGHRAASGGALTEADFARFLASLGFEPDLAKAA